MQQTKWPGWIQNLRGHYLAGSSSFFILHGNTADVIGFEEGEEYQVNSLADYLCNKLFAKYDLVMHYDMGRGLRTYSAGDQQRLDEMNTLLRRLTGRSTDLPREPRAVLRTIDHYINLLLVKSASGKSLKSAFMFDYGQMICPPGDRHSEELATFLNWARSPIVRRINLLFIVMADSPAQLHPSLVQSGYTQEIHIPIPNLDDRRNFINRRFPDSIQDAERLARVSAGLTLANLDAMLKLVGQKQESPPVQPISETEPQTRDAITDVDADELDRQGEEKPRLQLTDQKRHAPGDAILTGIKKQLIESQCPGLIEFIEPDLNLDLVAGHTAAKKRLMDDARLITAGRLESVPMGYLICGPVGVGKTFIAMCYAGTVGIPCVTLRSFRSKYVGETEANLEKILNVLRVLGPVAVIIDEADAAVGDRSASGDSGTSSRVFAQLAAQMGDTSYRGKIIWFLLTCRPDLLPVDLKRQGRCEEHVPLFYPQTPEELESMFMAMAKKLKIDLEKQELPDLSSIDPLSGADIESVLTRVRRESFLQKHPIDRDLISAALADFRSSRGLEHELQWLAAILECTDIRYLPKRVRKTVEMEGGLEALTARFREIRDRI